MRVDIKYKTYPIGSRGVWNRGNLKDLVLDIPELMWLTNSGTLPPIGALNQILLSGKCDTGMSGCCEWQPFEISDEEYTELIQEISSLTPF